MAPIVFVYGFPPKLDLDDFRAEFFEGVDENSYVSKLDYKAEKIYAFIHTKTVEQAQELIERWNNKPMRNSGENKLQVRLKGDSNNTGGGAPTNNRFNNNNGGQNNYMQRNKAPGQGGFNNSRGGYGGNAGHGGNQGNFGGYGGGRGGMNNQGTRNNYNSQNNSFQPNNNVQSSGSQPNQGGFNNRNQGNNSGGPSQPKSSNSQDGYAAALGPQKPVLYVYGFPKDMEQSTFEAEFLGGLESGHKQTDYFKEKLYCFIHCHDTDTCDNLIEKWDQKTMNGHDNAKPLQVRYKGMDSKTMQLLQSISPVLWVYGFPKGMTEDEFRQEFLLGMDVDKIDYFEQKLYAFVHCKDAKQGMKLINKWEGQMMSKSKGNLQVRFKNIPNKTTTFYNNQNQAMGDMPQQYNQTFGNNGQYYTNNMNQMQRQGNYVNNMNANTNIGYAMNQQQNFNQRNMPNQFVGRQNWNPTPMQNNMQMNDFGNNQLPQFRKNNQGGFNNRAQQPHNNFQHNQMNDGNTQFRNNQQQQQHAQPQMQMQHGGNYGNAMINNRR